MAKIEKIYSEGQLLAIVFRSLTSTKTTNFITDQKNPFQIGMQCQTKGTVLTPHQHVLQEPLRISNLQEIVFVISGKIRVTLYLSNRSIVGKRIINSGQAILLVSGGHGIEFLSDTHIFEVKQGPYDGVNTRKI